MTNVVTDKKKINDFLNSRFIDKIYPSSQEAATILSSGNKLKFYLGIDPTGPDIHLGHMTNFFILNDLADLGHEVILLVGDFTAQIGDPTDNTAARVQISEEEVKKNVKSWISQIRPLMSFNDRKNPPKIKYNSEWLSKMSWKDELVLASNFTVQQMEERDMFDKRLKNNIPIYLHEFQYPLMQGYDSVVMDVDVELCGTDQIFNALVGRTLLKRLKNKDKFVVAVNLMENPKTKELMSKSKGTGVFLSSPPKEMFGAIMAQSDEMAEVLFINVTRIPLLDKDKTMELGPREAKMLIARDIVKRFYGEEEAQKAKDEWEKVFSKGELPEDIKEVPGEGRRLVDFITEHALATSSSEAKRLLDQGAVSIDDEVVKEWGRVLKKGDIVRVGPRKFLKVS